MQFVKHKVHDSVVTRKVSLKCTCLAFYVSEGWEVAGNLSIPLKRFWFHSFPRLLKVLKNSQSLLVSQRLQSSPKVNKNFLKRVRKSFKGTQFSSNAIKSCRSVPQSLRKPRKSKFLGRIRHNLAKKLKKKPKYSIGTTYKRKNYTRRDGIEHKWAWDLISTTHPALIFRGDSRAFRGRVPSTK